MTSFTKPQGSIQADNEKTHFDIRQRQVTRKMVFEFQILTPSLNPNLIPNFGDQQVIFLKTISDATYFWRMSKCIARRRAMLNLVPEERAWVRGWVMPCARANCSQTRVKIAILSTFILVLTRSIAAIIPLHHWCVSIFFNKLNTFCNRNRISSAIHFSKYCRETTFSAWFAF